MFKRAIDNTILIEITETDKELLRHIIGDLYNSDYEKNEKDAIVHLLTELNSEPEIIGLTYWDINDVKDRATVELTDEQARQILVQAEHDGIDEETIEQAINEFEVQPDKYCPCFTVAPDITGDYKQPECTIDNEPCDCEDHEDCPRFKNREAQ